MKYSNTTFLVTKEFGNEMETEGANIPISATGTQNLQPHSMGDLVRHAMSSPWTNLAQLSDAGECECVVCGSLFFFVITFHYNL